MYCEHYFGAPWREGSNAQAGLLASGTEVSTQSKAIALGRRMGFSLIELLVVIAIIALLSAVVLASLATARMKARDARRVADMHQITLALELYYDANKNYPPVKDCPAYNCAFIYDYSGDQPSWADLQSKLAPYISRVPSDPLTNGISPWVDGGHDYVYGNVGNGVASSTTNVSGVTSYDLLVQFETPNHSLSCAKAGNYPGYFNRINWCDSWSSKMANMSLRTW